MKLVLSLLGVVLHEGLSALSALAAARLPEAGADPREEQRARLARFDRH